MKKLGILFVLLAFVTTWIGCEKPAAPPSSAPASAEGDKAPAAEGDKAPEGGGEAKPNAPK